MAASGEPADAARADSARADRGRATERVRTAPRPQPRPRPRPTSLALALALVALVAAALPARAGGDGEEAAPLVKLHDALAPVRANQAMLGTPLCVMVGYFPADQAHDWALDLCYQPEVVRFAGEVTFVRHRRSAVRDLEEDFLRRRGMPRRQAWEGIVVVDAHGAAVACLEAPVSVAALAPRLREACRRGAPPRATRFEKPGAPRFAFEVGGGVEASDLAPAGWDLELALPDRPGVRVLVRTRRLGPEDSRGEQSVFEEVAVERFLRNRAGTEVEERKRDHGELRGVTWCYRLKEPEPGARARAEALLGRHGDLFHVRVDGAAADASAKALAALLDELLPRLAPIPAKP